MDLEVTLPVTPGGLTDDPSTSSYPEVGPALSTPQKSELKDPLSELSDIFSDILGCTSTNDIKLITTDRVQAKVYFVPVHLKIFAKEVETLSSWALFNVLFHSTVLLSSCRTWRMVHVSDGN